MRISRPSWPRSLVGRVFMLYTFALCGFVISGLALFYRHEFGVGLEQTQLRADGLLSVMAPTVSDSAVIGDYDTIRRTLHRAIQHSDFASSAFIDVRGSTIKVENAERPAVAPPGWLVKLIASRLYDANQPINVGGRDYGVLRLSFAPEHIAGTLWQQSRVALVLVLIALAGGLVAIHLLLRRWLGGLDRLQSFDSGEPRESDSLLPVPDDAPIELRRTFETLTRAAQKRESALTALRSVLEGLMPSTAGQRPGGDDIAAISQMISALTLRLQERGAQLDAIFTLSPDGFVSFDAQRVVNYVSPAFVRLTGLGESALVGLDEESFAHGLRIHCGIRHAQFPSLQTLRDEALAKAEPGRHLVDIERPKRRVLEFALRIGRSSAVSQVLHLRDVTHESELDQMKSEFLSTAAHELRTPMTSIFGFVELMLKREMPPGRQRELLATVHRNSALMISIINELLDLARIEARRGKDFEIVVIDLVKLVPALAGDFKPPQGREPPRIALPYAPAPVAVDRKKFAQALGNVLSNAYKYSPAGGPVELALYTSAGMAVLSVTDHGIGMTPEQTARVCERFFRADASGSIPGTGLGMSIVKEIVELHGGRLTIYSEAGVGTSVQIELPLAEALPVPAPTQPATFV